MLFKGGKQLTNSGRGGKRPNSGRPSIIKGKTLSERITFRVTAEEKEKMKKYLKELRG